MYNRPFSISPSERRAIHSHLPSIRDHRREYDVVVLIGVFRGRSHALESNRVCCRDYVVRRHFTGAVPSAVLLLGRVGKSGDGHHVAAPVVNNNGLVVFDATEYLTGTGVGRRQRHLWRRDVELEVHRYRRPILQLRQLHRSERCRHARISRIGRQRLRQRHLQGQKRRRRAARRIGEPDLQPVELGRHQQRRHGGFCFPARR